MASVLESKIVSLQRIENSPNLLIFVQGSWEVGDNPRNLAASKEIVEKQLASTLLYESSRDWLALQNARTSQEWINAFNNKNYHLELSELRAIIAYANTHLQPKEIFLSGSSFGGGLVTLASNSALNITRILLSSPQIYVADYMKKMNIYSGFPDEKSFFESISSFRGDLTILHPDNDQNIPLSESISLYNAAKTSKKRLIVLPGDHTFTGESQVHYVNQHLAAFR